MGSFRLFSPLLLMTADLVLSKASELHVLISVGKIVGFIDTAIPAVRQWRGVRFAEPLFGPLHFLPPSQTKEPIEFFYGRGHATITTALHDYCA